MVKGAIKQPLRIQAPPLGGCWYIYNFTPKTRRHLLHEQMAPPILMTHQVKVQHLIPASQE